MTLINIFFFSLFQICQLHSFLTILFWPLYLSKIFLNFLFLGSYSFLTFLNHSSMNLFALSFFLFFWYCLINLVTSFQFSSLNTFLENAFILSIFLTCNKLQYNYSLFPSTLLSSLVPLLPIPPLPAII